MKGTLVLAGSVIVGNYVAERFILKKDSNDPTGFIEVADGLGPDDVARAAVIVGFAILGRKLFGG